MINPLKPSG